MVDLILKDSEALPERWCVFTHVMGVGWRETSAFVPIHGCSGSQNERPSFVLSARSMFFFRCWYRCLFRGVGRCQGPREGTALSAGPAPPFGDVSRPVDKAYFYSAPRSILH